MYRSKIETDENELQRPPTKYRANSFKPDKLIFPQIHDKNRTERLMHEYINFLFLRKTKLPVLTR